MNYTIDRSKIRREIPLGKKPIVLIACGSFSPPTYLHLRIFEDAKIKLEKEGYCVVAGYMSPVHQKYGKATLAPMHNRVDMVKLALKDSTWIMPELWETLCDEWTPTAQVLQHINEEFNKVPLFDEHHVKLTAEIRLLCGTDLLQTFNDTNPDGTPLWAPEDQIIILQDNGLVCIERHGTNHDEVVASIRNNPILEDYRARITPVRELVSTSNCGTNYDVKCADSPRDKNITLVKPLVTNTISSTIVRRLLVNGHSIKYLVPPLVENYIMDNYLDRLPEWQGCYEPNS